MALKKKKSIWGAKKNNPACPEDTQQKGSHETESGRNRNHGEERVELSPTTQLGGEADRLIPFSPGV